MLVLLLETDQTRGNLMFDALRDLEITLHWVSSTAEADQAVFEENFDLIVVDLAFLQSSARRVDFVCDLRQKSPASNFLAITADHRDALALDGCVEALLAEPLDLLELADSVRAMAHRQDGNPGRHAVMFGDLYINFAFRVAEIDGREVNLTSREFGVLRALASQWGTVVSKEQIIASAFDTGIPLGSNSLEVHIHNLRGKLGPQRISTVRGRGYRLNATR
jgi:DNA-binding response OmpR family regulator